MKSDNSSGSAQKCVLSTHNSLKFSTWIWNALIADQIHFFVFPSLTEQTYCCTCNIIVPVSGPCSMMSLCQPPSQPNMEDSMSIQAYFSSARPLTLRVKTAQQKEKHLTPLKYVLYNASWKHVSRCISKWISLPILKCIVLNWRTEFLLLPPQKSITTTSILKHGAFSAQVRNNKQINHVFFRNVN